MTVDRTLKIVVMKHLLLLAARQFDAFLVRDNLLETNLLESDCLMTLHEFCQKIRQPLPEYNTTSHNRLQKNEFKKKQILEV